MHPLLLLRRVYPNAFGVRTAFGRYSLVISDRAGQTREFTEAEVHPLEGVDINVFTMRAIFQTASVSGDQLTEAPGR